MRRVSALLASFAAAVVALEGCGETVVKGTGGGSSESTTGSAPATSGTGGTGGTIVTTPADKVDLLMMIDNSRSMADKQLILALAVPDLLGRLVNPRCVDAAGQPAG